ncbi:CDC45 family [Lipomyces chichibuensis]|uniref:CDC45 family n=1 Tax=Lipomyces chichibuensis TaxID=1546026 RepID=UPI0033430C74
MYAMHYSFSIELCVDITEPQRRDRQSNSLGRKTMHVSPSSYARAFTSLRASTLSHTTCRLVLFVACLDVDALCAAKIFSGILKHELIPHRTCPVAGYSELRARYSELDDEITTVVLLGCGALVDLTAYLREEENDDEEDQDEENLVKRRRERRKIYVFDNHRPWNLQNVFGPDDVVCFDDGDVEDGLLDKEREAYEALLKLSDAEDSESDEDDEDDEEHASDSDAETDQEREVVDDDLSEDDPASEADDVQETPTTRQSGLPDSTPSSKRKSPSSPRSPLPSPRRQKSTRQIRREYEDIIANYYTRGTAYSTPVASQLYSLLSFLGDTSTHDLWLSIVGTTALDTLAPELYRRLFPLFCDEVRRLNPSATTVKLSADDTTLVIQPDFRMFLLRHWTLYDAILHSPYVASRLQLWTDDGRKKLHKMLAKMGVSLSVARERWTHTDVSLKRELKDRISNVAEVFGIGNVVRTGVVRKFGFRGAVTAGDAVESVAALLECGRGKSVVDKENVNPDAKDVDEAKEIYKDAWIDNFWTGWDALDDVELLLHGVQRAQALQQAVVRTGTALLEKNQVLILRTFRLAVLKDGPDLELFSNPITLIRLASWVNECKAEQDDRQIPMVMAALDRTKDTYTVVGLPARVLKQSGKEGAADDDDDWVGDEEVETMRNSFGITFQEVAKQTHARVRIDSFESSVVEVRKDDLTGFLEGMTIVGVR